MDVLAARGDAKAAAAQAREYLAIAPHNSRVRAHAGGESPMPEASDYAASFRVGLELGHRERYIDSALAYRAALRFDPQSPDALNNLGWTLGKLGFIDEAIPQLEAALSLCPDFQLARNNLGWVRSRLLGSDGKR